MSQQAEHIVLDISGNATVIINGRKRFICDICDKTLNRGFALRRHLLRQHVNTNIMTQEELDYYEVSERTVETRESYGGGMEGSEEGDYVCRAHQKFFATKEELKAHWRMSNHKRGELGEDGELEEQERRCPKCNKTFKRDAWLSKHKCIGSVKEKRTNGIPAVQNPLFGTEVGNPFVQGYNRWSDPSVERTQIVEFPAVPSQLPITEVANLNCFAEGYKRECGPTIQMTPRNTVTKYRDELSYGYQVPSAPGNMTGHHYPQAYNEQLLGGSHGLQIWPEAKSSTFTIQEPLRLNAELATGPTTPVAANTMLDANSAGVAKPNDGFVTAVSVRDRINFDQSPDFRSNPAQQQPPTNQVVGQNHNSSSNTSVYESSGEIRNPVCFGNQRFIYPELAIDICYSEVAYYYSKGHVDPHSGNWLHELVPETAIKSGHPYSCPE